MAKLSDLVVQTSQVTGIGEATVRELARRLREAELIGTGKGGRYGGADMSSRDAARLLTGLLIVRATSLPLNEIAALTSIYLKGIKAHTGRGKQMVLARWDRNLGLHALCELDRGHTF